MTQPAAAPCPRCGRDGSVPAVLPFASYCARCAVTLWPTLEPRYAKDTYTGTHAPGIPHVVHGRENVVISTINSVRFYRGMERQPGGKCLGSCCEVLAGLTGGTAVTLAGPPRSLPFLTTPEPGVADELAKVVAPSTFVLELLGMRDRGELDVCLGTGPAPDARAAAVTEFLMSRLNARGFRTAVNQPFSAKNPIRVTSFAQKELHASALTVGIAAWVRDPTGLPTQAHLFLDTLREGLALAVTSSR